MIVLLTRKNRAVVAGICAAALERNAKKATAVRVTQAGATGNAVTYRLK